ncbi:DUF350 domain-containing protein [Actinocorallia sp. A-T 12471]|uniref:DUF350 domain-containing protein n=1 Tax=Actinocorallia sp. A-T 12471 TaxID=3089813 RepID=UPI0029CF65A2|nr:DUF350 domain-containing protein [Actinocorallia sp. A-T 12471]MDX6743454.1 DUF350 domain-containing protein [Actinocorallia sp. A-T 12471]
MSLDSAFAEILGQNVLAILAYAALGLVLFVIGFYVVDLATPGRLVSVIRHDRNPNATLLAGAGMVAVGVIVSASIFATDAVLLEGLLATAVYGVVGIVGQVVAMLVFDLIIGFKIKELCRETTLQPGTWLLAVTHVMIGLVTALAVI